MRVLYIANRDRTGGWLAEALAADSASEVILEEAVGMAAGLARLRDAAFDAVLVCHDPGELDALELIEGYRAGGADEPIVVLGSQSEQEMAALCYEVGADGYVCVNTTTTRTLIWVLARAIQRQQLARENQRLSQAEQQRVQRERDEAERLLVQQRVMIGDLGKGTPPIRDGRDCSAEQLLASSPWAAASEPAGRRGDGAPGLPAKLVRHYRELLRTYVIMGSGNLAGELSRLADLLAAAGVTSRQTMQLHIQVLEELIRGLGARSTRHVISRADLLAMEMMLHLAECYRKRYLARAFPPVQPMLPGFEDERPVLF